MIAVLLYAALIEICILIYMVYAKLTYNTIILEPYKMYNIITVLLFLLSPILALIVGKYFFLIAFISSVLTIPFYTKLLGIDITIDELTNVEIILGFSIIITMVNVIIFILTYGNYICNIRICCYIVTLIGGNYGHNYLFNSD